MHDSSRIDALAIPGLALAPRTWFQQFCRRFVATRPQRVVCLLIGLWLINGFDVVLTMAAHRQGLLDETNPIAARLLSHSPAAVLLYKLALVTFASTVLLTHRRQFIAEIAATGMLVIYLLVAVHWRLCYELYDVTFMSHAYLNGLEAIGTATWAPFLPPF